MKRNSATVSLAFRAKRANLPQMIVILVSLSLVTGFFIDSNDEMLAYMLAWIVCALPCVLWISAGTPGIPLLPPICVMFFIYYALPILRRNTNIVGFAPSEVLSAVATMSLFIVMAAVPWWMLLVRNDPTSRKDVADLLSGRRLIQIIFVGLASGVVYYVTLYAGWLNWLGPSFGLVRSIMLTTTTAACFLLGHCRAQGSIRGIYFAIAVTCFCVIIVLTWISLFLVGGLIMGAAAVLGYVITCKRLPWKLLSAVLPIVIILHAGKDTMREKYWVPGSNSVNVQLPFSDMPGMMAEWVGYGLMATQSQNNYRSAIDRASLLHILLQVQRLTPDYVPFLEGESYALLPEMLIPRFLDPEKITSQASMNMLNVRYGFLSSEETEKTAAGLGLIAEAYANFGRFGVMEVGFLLGLLCGFVERWTTGAAIVSLPTFCAVIILMQLINVEADAAQLLTTLFQSIVSISCIFWIMQSMAKHKLRLPQSAKGMKSPGAA